MERMEILLMIVIFFCLMAGAATIFLMVNLRKKYDLNYISSFLYYAISIIVFGINGLIGTVLSRIFLENQGATTSAVELVGHFFVFLGLPFIILAWYLFLRMCYELLRKKLSQTYTTYYFVIQSVLLLIYGLALLYTSLIDDQFLHLLTDVAVYYWLAVDLVVRGIGIYMLLNRSNTLALHAEQNNARNLGRIFLVIFLITGGLFAFINLSEYVLGILLIFFFINNIPPILYLNNYLRKNYRPELETSDMEKLVRLFSQHGISNREEEVISLIVAGKSNKQIASSLYITLQTVKDHTHRIYSKLNVKNRVQLANLVHENS